MRTGSASGSTPLQEFLGEPFAVPIRRGFLFVEEALELTPLILGFRIAQGTRPNNLYHLD